ncbi:sigma factor-binding protein Crl [Vibrio sp. SS-MA-C1-2]|uniref:sigma factor-binding protein Crl n=1 Tax=Vibrio sp. SS-MA-C1-2 TaxID=2908646 RepID=UPI001F3D0BEF|nr:sigma factor-binding protein Crl [Vibrio sp. SS-MA-C1-2]UJF18829.1 sigma factor-binding protein Crl [Vibrio sp. SS-MA-C1-2]
MPEDNNQIENKKPVLSHPRVMAKLLALGPYLRSEQSNKEGYFFDCLAVCLDPEKTPESREFWGWCLELTPLEEGFAYRYTFGQYDLEGKWINNEIPKEHQDEVQKTLDVFYNKLSKLVEKELELPLQAHSKFSGDILVSVA